jgi:hypothetical protein
LFTDFVCFSIKSLVALRQTVLCKGKKLTLQLNENLDNGHDELHNETRAWLKHLPRNVEPRALVKQFPRLANDIARLWSDAPVCGKFIDNLLFGTRNGTREGFPYEVAFELSYLKALTVYRTGKTDIADDCEEINIHRSNN